MARAQFFKRRPTERRLASLELNDPIAERPPTSPTSPTLAQCLLVPRRPVGSYDRAATSRPGRRFITGSSGGAEGPVSERQSSLTLRALKPTPRDPIVRLRSADLAKVASMGPTSSCLSTPTSDLACSPLRAGEQPTGRRPSTPEVEFASERTTAPPRDAEAGSRRPSTCSVLWTSESSAKAPQKELERSTFRISRPSPRGALASSRAQSKDVEPSGRRVSLPAGIPEASASSVGLPPWAHPEALVSQLDAEDEAEQAQVGKKALKRVYTSEDLDNQFAHLMTIWDTKHEGPEKPEEEEWERQTSGSSSNKKSYAELLSTVDVKLPSLSSTACSEGAVENPQPLASGEASSNTDKTSAILQRVRAKISAARSINLFTGDLQHDQRMMHDMEMHFATARTPNRRSITRVITSEF